MYLSQINERVNISLITNVVWKLLTSSNLLISCHKVHNATGMTIVLSLYKLLHVSYSLQQNAVEVNKNKNRRKVQ